MTATGTGVVPSWVSCAAESRARTASDESGDCYVAHGDERAFVAAVVDGLGHGPSAREAARAAALPFAGDGALREPLDSLMRRAHETARETRGAAVTAVRVTRAPLAVETLAVGNVDGVVRAAGCAKERVFLAGGVVGFRIPRLRPSRTEVEQPLVVALATDGLDPRFASDAILDGPFSVARTARLLLERYRLGTDDALAFLLRVEAT